MSGPFGRRMVLRGLIVAILLWLTAAFYNFRRFAGGHNTAPALPGIERVILVVIDAARADRFSFTGYPRETTPNIDALSRSGIVFENCLAQATDTRASLPSLFYSRYYTAPMLEGSLHTGISPQFLFLGKDAAMISLPQLLKSAGYITALISPHPYMEEGTSIANEYDYAVLLRPTPDEKKYGSARARHVVDAAIDYIQAHGLHRLFLYLHFMDTHEVRLFEPDCRRFYKETLGVRLNHKNKPNALINPLSSEDRRYLDAVYDCSLAAVDQELGRLFQVLQDLGLWRGTLLIITADHGEHLLEVAGRWAHGGPWYDAVAKVPLVIAAPGVLSYARVSGMVEHVDIFPTILDLTGIKLPSGKSLDGVSLMSAAARRRRVAYSRGGIRTKRYKAIFEPDFWTAHSRAVTADTAMISKLPGMLYDLMKDPLETANLWESKPKIARKLHARYQEKLLPRYKRYIESKSSFPPKLPFAIQVSALEPVTEYISSTQRLRELSHESASLPGWIKYHSWQRHPWIVAFKKAPPLKLAIPVPNGRYTLSVSVAGQCQLALGDRVFTLHSQKDISTAAQEELLWSHGSFTSEINLGAVHIADNALEVTLSLVQDNTPCLLEKFSFYPETWAPPSGQSLDHTIEQLKTLGYLGG